MILTQYKWCNSDSGSSEPLVFVLFLVRLNQESHSRHSRSYPDDILKAILNDLYVATWITKDHPVQN
jgi:hypothetical protein